MRYILNLAVTLVVLPVFTGLTFASDGVTIYDLYAKFLKEDEKRYLSSCKVFTQDINDPKKGIKCLLVYTLLAAQSFSYLHDRVKFIDSYSYDDLLVLAKLSYEKAKRTGIVEENLVGLKAIWYPELKNCKVNKVGNYYQCGGFILYPHSKVLKYREGLNTFTLFGEGVLLNMRKRILWTVTNNKTQNMIQEFKESIQGKEVDLELILRP